jgi:hypothetical protein
MHNCKFLKKNASDDAHLPQGDAIPGSYSANRGVPL